MGVECPNLVVGVHTWQGMDSKVHDVGYFNGAAFACYIEGYWYGFRTEHAGDERCESTQWTTNRASKDGLKSLKLLTIFGSTTLHMIS